MSYDPNNTKWSRDENRVGKKMMEKAGWSSGKGLGRDESGDTSHVKTSRKDDVLGLGYDAKVQSTWSTQSVGFADILSKFKKRDQNAAEGTTAAPESGAVGEAEDAADTAGTGVVATGKHGNAYSKRRRLKTEALTSGEGKEEVLGTAASGKRKRIEGSPDAITIEPTTTLNSLVLKRTTLRCPKHEPQITVEDENTRVDVTKPDPRPPKCTSTPFRH